MLFLNLFSSISTLKFGRNINSLKSYLDIRIKKQLYWEIGQGIGDKKEHKKLVEELKKLEKKINEEELKGELNENNTRF